MIFVIVFVVVYCSLQSECAPLTDNIMNITFPRPVVHASSVNISGNLNVSASMLRANITGNELGEKESCPIEIKPQEDKIVIGASDETYTFSTGDKEVIPFALTITARSNSDGSVSLHLSFNGNEAGMQDFENPCKFESFESLDGISLEGFKHIRRLTFEYKDKDDDD